MIREDFLSRAVDIRRNYLNLTKSLDKYLSKVEDVSNRLEKVVADITKLQESYETSSDKYESEKVLKELLKFLDRIEEEGRKLESIINPINADIEKLSKEETELYRLIKESYSSLSDEQIVKQIRKRLDSEGLI